MSSYIGKEINFKQQATKPSSPARTTMELVDFENGRTAKKSTEGVVWDLTQYNIYLLLNLTEPDYGTNISTVIVAAGEINARVQASEGIWDRNYDYGEHFWLNPKYVSVTQIGIALKSQAIGRSKITTRVPSTISQDP